MASQELGRRALALFADILDYPGPGTAEAVEGGHALLARLCPEAAQLLEPLLRLARSTSLGHLEELYTGFFDLNPVCHPYVGYHLFGESYKRSLFLLGLKERYRSCGFQADPSELPDRLSTILRFLAHTPDPALGEELVREGLLPALERMAPPRGAPPPPADGDVQLQGHSQGEVLDGGFLLGAGDDPPGGGQASDRGGPYRGALRALYLMLKAASVEPAQGQGVGLSGGKEHA